MTMPHSHFREVLARYHTGYAIARELNMRDATMPMLVGMLPVMSFAQVAEVVATLMRFRTRTRKVAVACTVVDGLVYLERVDMAMPVTIAMVVNRNVDMSDLAEALELVHAEQQAARMVTLPWNYAHAH